MNDGIGHIVNSHTRYGVRFEYGDGMYLYADDRKYLDFMAGIAVSSLGHNNKIIVNAIRNQAQKLIHVSNVFYTDVMIETANTLCKHAGMANVFFCNSGGEAIEAAIKMTRKFYYDKGEKHRNEIITFNGAFHGRTIAAISAMNDEYYKKEFYPVLGGFKYVEYGSIESLKSAINENTAGIMIEPIQGEGGIVFGGWNYLKEVATIAKESDILLIADEIQCGAGRTGKFLALQNAGIEADIVTMAKGIGGGFPVGATLFNEKTKNVMSVGSHGTTFGGNPLAMAVTNAVCSEISSQKFLENVVESGNYLKEQLKKVQNSFPGVVEDVRGVGLMVGFKCFDGEILNKDLAQKFLENGLLTMPARNNVIRLLPPLVAEKHHIDEAIEIIIKTFKYL